MENIYDMCIQLIITRDLLRIDRYPGANITKNFGFVLKYVLFVNLRYEIKYIYECALREDCLLIIYQYQNIYILKLNLNLCCVTGILIMYTDVKMYILLSETVGRSWLKTSSSVDPGAINFGVDKNGFSYRTRFNGRGKSALGQILGCSD